VSAPKLHHFSPVFGNVRWGDAGGYVCYARDVYVKRITRAPKGPRQWGRKKKLYRHMTEIALNKEIETPAAPLYEALLQGRPLDSEERRKWSQFLLSQVVRTPSFMRYEVAARALTETTGQPTHDRVGCEDCADLAWVANRDWCLFASADGDCFIRTDNPVYMTGFLSQPATALYYPLNPRVCFVACSMPSTWDPSCSPIHADDPCAAYALVKGGASLIDFYLAKAADESAVVSPRHDNNVLRTMLTQVLGVFPQPPFLLHELGDADETSALESVRTIMRYADGYDYGLYAPHEMQPRYHPARSPNTR